MKISQRRMRSAAGLLLLAALTLAAPAPAQGVLQAPGSLLLFSEFDSRPGHDTLLTVTNTNRDFTASGAGLAGSVRVMFLYIDASTCLEFNRTHVLTPGDTVTVLASVHNPSMQRGYVYAMALAPSGFQPAIAWNWLVGTSIVTDGLGAFSYSVDPFTFRAGAALPEGALTDLDSDGLQDLDGLEYQQTPDRLLFPRFTGQDATHTSELVLLNLSGAREFDAVVNLLIYNDNSEAFSQQFLFRCWSKTPLSTVALTTTNAFLQQSTQHAPLEPVGAAGHETGWFSVDGSTAFSDACQLNDPAILGILIESLGADAHASLPFASGSQANGNLVDLSDCP